MFTLRIHRTANEPRPVPGTTALHELRGGPGHLLEWLETQLGWPLGRVTRFERTRRYLHALEGTVLELGARSLATDAWATATELLRRRDELRLAGWRPQPAGEGASQLPPLVRDLAAVEATLAADPDCRLPPGEAERVERVQAALDAGQLLPEHQILLEESIDEWPPAWRPLLARLHTMRLPPPQPRARGDSALGAAQRRVAAADEVGAGVERTETERERPTTFPQDASLGYVRAASATLACRVVATLLVEASVRTVDTVILCEDAATALTLDDCLAEVGLPTMGVASRNSTHPALQVLPLVLELCWEPVDPQLLLDFLTLPIRPLPRSLTRPLVEALVAQPGLGSRRWEEARAELSAPERDPTGSTAETLRRWLDHERWPRHLGLPVTLVAERCRIVAQWANTRAFAYESGETSARDSESSRDGVAPAANPVESRVRRAATAELARTLRSAAAHAHALAEIVASWPYPVTESQLPRLLEATHDGARRHPRPALAGMPRFVSHLSQVHNGCERLIWLGTGTADPHPTRWTHSELQGLAAAGIEVDDGRLALVHARRAERRGFAEVRSELLVVQLPADDEQRPHPVWTRVRTALEPREPVLLEQAIAGVASSAGAARQRLALRIPTRDHRVLPPPSPPALWRVDPDLVRDRTRSSASELNDRLGCPLKWVLKYPARLRASDVGNLSPDFRLKGNLSHQILAEVFSPYAGPTFGEARPLPEIAEAARRVEECFDMRVVRDAAPLAQPGMAVERVRLRRELAASARRLIHTLTQGGYRIAGFEVPIASRIHGRELMGFVDCLLLTDSGAEAVVDFKFGGPALYRQLIEQGRAVQLATYAGARHRESGLKEFPRVGYLIISTADIFTPQLHALLGTEEREQVPGAPPIQDVWIAFQDALAGAEEWFETGEIPVRPRQSPLEWPKGVDLILAHAEQQPTCSYCDFGGLCGLKETR
ncbi:MAG: PD-(D/E)XK nuclease family protein [Planctomycetota bacterium]